jgi:Fe-S cluster biosynthesis and repair protein YggX
MEVCRICEARVSLEGMERHVRTCQRRSTLRQQIEDKNAELQKLYGELKKVYEKVSEEAWKSEQDQRFRIVARVVLSREQKKERTIMRRASLTGVKSEKSIRNKVETVLENYLDEYGEHEVLENIQRALGEKVFL